jgi:hypothetical protein
MVETKAQAGKDQTEEKLHFQISGLIAENEGNIKDYYKISSCIGRGKQKWVIYTVVATLNRDVMFFYGQDCIIFPTEFWRSRLIFGLAFSGSGLFNDIIIKLLVLPFCSGAYGEVRKCLNKDTKSLRAVKIINKKYLEEDEKAKLLSEINILKQMDHPNILKLYEFFQDHKRYFLVTE